MSLHLLNQGATLAGLFMQNDGLEAKPLKKTRNGLARAIFTTMNDEHLTAERRQRRRVDMRLGWLWLAMIREPLLQPSNGLP
jgi:hypothetical protein